jgi:hypothetical protein
MFAEQPLPNKLSTQPNQHCLHDKLLFIHV